jgi:Nucleotide modification associated domain 2
MLASYVVRWDHGFAPNPFYGTCTLATCKPAIRKRAEVGDWVLGTGSAQRDFAGRAIFLMKVGEIICFDDYWDAPSFDRKRPVMNGSLKQRFGDNIYHHNEVGAWLQEDSRHSQDGSVNDHNLVRDTATTDRVLMGTDFIYWGDTAPSIPKSLMNFVISHPGYANRFADADIDALVNWAYGLGARGQVGDPLEWRWESSWARSAPPRKTD